MKRTLAKQITNERTPLTPVSEAVLPSLPKNRRMDSTNVVASAAQLYWCVLLKVLALYTFALEHGFISTNKSMLLKEQIVQGIRPAVLEAWTLC
jgi:hypothetical protein